MTMQQDLTLADDAPPRPRTGALRCRAIVASDIPAVIALLVEGFEGRSAAHWRHGIDHHLARPLPDDVPRLGFVIEANGVLVGVLLTLYSTRVVGERVRLICNLSSWYVRPAYRAYAGLLDSIATRRKDVTYVNVSAVRRTWPMHEARGFRRFAEGEFVAVPVLAPPRPGARVRSVAASGSCRGLPDAECRVLVDHARFGCICLIVTDERGSEPLVFIRRSAEPIRRRLGWSPLSYFQLIHCRPTLDWPRYAHALGRYLLRHHAMPWIVVDATGPVPGLPGHFIAGWGTKFARGAASMRNGDLAYTELALFGD